MYWAHTRGRSPARCAQTAACQTAYRGGPPSSNGFRHRGHLFSAGLGARALPVDRLGRGMAQADVQLVECDDTPVRAVDVQQREVFVGRVGSQRLFLKSIKFIILHRFLAPLPM